MRSLMIFPERKEIGLFTSVPMDGGAEDYDHPFFATGQPVGNDLRIAFIPRIDNRGNVLKERFFVVTDEDIIEGEGIGVVWRTGGDVDENDLRAIKERVVWERF